MKSHSCLVTSIYGLFYTPAIPNIFHTEISQGNEQKKKKKNENGKNYRIELESTRRIEQNRKEQHREREIEISTTDHQ